MNLLDSESGMIEYSRALSGGKMLLKVNPSLCDYVQREGLTVRTWVVTSFQSPGNDGFPIEMEKKLLVMAEKELVARVKDDGQTAYLGSLTHQGQLVLVFHSRMENLLGPGPACRYNGTRYQWLVYYNNDPSFSFLSHKLVPTAVEMRRIKDAEVIQELVKVKDQQEVPRPLTFYGLFPEKEWAESAAVMLAKHGFRTSPASEMPGNAEMNWSLMFQKSSPTDPQAIEIVSAKALDICTRCNGIYDGWSCEPVTIQ